MLFTHFSCSDNKVAQLVSHINLPPLNTIKKELCTYVQANMAAMLSIFNKGAPEGLTCKDFYLGVKQSQLQISDVDVLELFLMCDLGNNGVVTSQALQQLFSTL